MTYIWKGSSLGGGGGDVGSFEICHLSAGSVIFKQGIFCSFLRMGDGGLQNWSFCVDVINIWPLSSIFSAIQILHLFSKS